MGPVTVAQLMPNAILAVAEGQALQVLTLTRQFLELVGRESLRQ